MRKIILDTETTGLDFRTGDRVVEIGCVELVGRQRAVFVSDHLYDVPAKVGLDGLADLAGFLAEGGFLERRYHRTFCEPAQVTARFAIAGVFGEFLCQGGEIFAFQQALTHQGLVVSNQKGGRHAASPFICSGTFRVAISMSAHFLLYGSVCLH